MKPVIPYGKHLGPIKDLAQDVIAASAGLEGRIAPETSKALGGKLRLINSYYSNLIEGHKVFIPEIEQALANEYCGDDEKRYAQELCSAHIKAEVALMDMVEGKSMGNASDLESLKTIHYEFYSHLPDEHLFTYGENGFTERSVCPGELRNFEVAVHDDGETHGPTHTDLTGCVNQFADDYNLARYHGDEKLIAMAAAHHQLAWLHPFRDGNGRVCRLYSGLFMAQANLNRGNLWSLSRGLFRKKAEYMFNLRSVDPAPNDTPESLNERLADFCEFFLGVCLDQIDFMARQLCFKKMESRIEWYVSGRSERKKTKLNAKASRLLKAVFMQGKISRGRAPTIMNTSETTSRRIVRQLIVEGLITSPNHRAPLAVALPMQVLSYYFPSLYTANVLGSEYVEMLGGTD